MFPFSPLEGGVTREVMVPGGGGQMRVRMVMRQQTREKRDRREALITGMTPTVTISTFKLSFPDLYFSFLNHLPAEALSWGKHSLFNA